MVRRSLDQQDLAAEPIESLEEIAKDLEKTLGQVRSAKDAKRAEAKRAEVNTLGAGMRFVSAQRGLNVQLSASQVGPADDSKADPAVDLPKLASQTDLAKAGLSCTTDSTEAGLNGVTDLVTESADAEEGAEEGADVAPTNKLRRRLTLQRLRLRGVLESSQCETATLLLILIYGLL